MLAVDLTNSGRHVVTTQELKKQLNGLSIATDCLLRAVRARRRRPQLSRYSSTSPVSASASFVAALSLGATGTEIRAAPDFPTAISRSGCAVRCAQCPLYCISPGRWHFVGREGGGDRNGPKTPDNTHPPTHPRARPAHGRAGTEPARNGGNPGRQEAPTANRGRPRGTPGSADQTGTAPRGRKKERERERERKNPPTHPGARRRDGRDPPLRRGGQRAGSRHTGATLAYEGLRPAGGRSGATGRCGGGEAGGGMARDRPCGRWRVPARTRAHMRRGGPGRAGRCGRWLLACIPRGGR